LTCAGLLLHSLWKLESVPLGMETNNVLVARFVRGRSITAATRTNSASSTSWSGRVAGAPGVEAAAISDSIPPSGGMRGHPLAARRAPLRF